MTPKTSPKTPKLTKGLSIDEPLYKAAVERARQENRSFAFIVCRAIERDLIAKKVTKDTPQTVNGTDELMPISEVCTKLNISVWTARRRAGKKGDPLRLARSRIGKQKPMHFLRSRIEQMERELSAA